MKPAKALSLPQIRQRLARKLPQWELRDGHLARKYVTPGWSWTLMLVNHIGYLSEAACHHPDLEVSYAAVTVKLSTHSAGGITEKDLALAQVIEDSVPWLPEARSPLDGFEKGFKKQWVR